MFSRLLWPFSGFCEGCQAVGFQATRWFPRIQVLLEDIQLLSAALWAWGDSDTLAQKRASSGVYLVVQ